MSNCSHNFIKLYDKANSLATVVCCPHCGQVREIHPGGVVVVTIEQGEVRFIRVDDEK